MEELNRRVAQLQPDLNHQANEYISLADLAANTRLYAHAIYALAR